MLDLAGNHSCQHHFGRSWRGGGTQIHEDQRMSTGTVLQNLPWPEIFSWGFGMLITDLESTGCFLRPEPGLPTEQGIESPDHFRLRTPVGGQGIETGASFVSELLHLISGFQISVNVRTPKRVNGLFWIADQEETIPAALMGILQKESFEYSPLNRVRILKLVDESDVVSISEFIHQNRCIVVIQGLFHQR